jgi:hypothetical protein
VEFVFLIVHRFVVWIEGLSDRPLRRAVPNLDHLLSDPAGTLAGGEITIRSHKRYVSFVILALLFFAIGQAVVILLLTEMLGQPVTLRKRILIASVVVGVVIGSFLLAWRFTCGGRCILTVDGVSFRHRGIEVFCPWTLFNVDGQPVIRTGSGGEQIEFALPVSADAVPLVEVRRHGQVVAQGQAVKSRQFRFRSANEAVLKAIYQVKAAELAPLLLQLGRLLGKRIEPSASVVDAGEEIVSAPAAAWETDGWVVISLTRLFLPPYCCQCEQPTTRTVVFRGVATALRIGRFLNIQGGECISIWVPLCQVCEAAARPGYWRAYFKALLLTALVCAGIGFSGGMVLAARAGDPAAFAFLPMILAVVGGLLSLSFGWVIAAGSAKRATTLVQLDRFRPSKGSVAIRFRNPAYALQVLEATRGRRASETNSELDRAEFPKPDMTTNESIRELRAGAGFIRFGDGAGSL